MAFHGDSGGNFDVYVAPVATGEPKRLTYHPKDDAPAWLDTGWKTDTVQFRRVS
jgi:hypothetical protein